MLERALQEDFRQCLRNELLKRCKANPRYSLRAYSRALGVQSSFLSKIINGKRSITPGTMERFAEPLGLAPMELARLQGRAGAKGAVAGQESLNDIALDSFQFISDWYHFAILELFSVAGFKPTSAYIAKRLGIPRVAVLDALARLKRLGLIEGSPALGYRIRKGGNTTTGYPRSSVALRKMQRQVLEMAIQAMDDVPLEQRDQSTMTMAIDSRLLPEAKEKIKVFRRGLCEFLQKKRKTDCVFHLSISLYPVTRMSSPKE